jgi:catechol 2,3-dioxygenase-like lactoylglutathione lyase family enzyme
VKRPINVEGMAPLLQVFDMPRAIAFYRDVLGFEVTGRSGGEGDDVDWCLLKLDGTAVMLNTAYERPERPATPDAKRVAAHDDTCLYFSVRDLDGAYTYLKSHGVTLEPPKVAHYGMRQLYFKDLDGYQICFQWAAT